MIFQNLLLFTAAVGALLTLLTVAGANMYDLRAIKMQRQLNRQPQTRRYRHRPFLTVIIPTHNDERLIERTLFSVTQSSYHKLEIIVVDGSSQDTTKELVKRFIGSHPKKLIRLVAKRKSASAAEAFVQGYRAHAQGQLIMWLQPGQSLDKSTLTNAARHFNGNSRLGVLSCNRRVRTAYTVTGLFQWFELLLSCRPQKFNSISNTDYAMTGEAAVYRRAVLDQLLPTMQWPLLRLGNRHIRLGYGSDVVIYDALQPSFRALIGQRYLLQLGRLDALRSYRRLFFARDEAYTKLLTWFRLPFAVCVGIAALGIPVLLTYFIYLAIYLHQPELYTISLALLTLFTVFMVWGDERLNIRQKAGYSLLTPIVQGVFYLLSFVQIAVVLKSLMSREPTS